MVEQGITPLHVHQCLFGYDDGHRLLASSIQMPSEASSVLLRHSDLESGLQSDFSNGYWTGISLPAAKQYALLKTWPAPEMPRPGCVWTHVILIGFADIARLVDLSYLTSLVRRPLKNSSYETYGRPIPISAESAQGTDQSSSRNVDPNRLLKVIRAIYKTTESVHISGIGDELDDAIFRIWSQQWPSLRRSFSFRTAAIGSVRQSPSLRFDVRVLHDPESGGRLQVQGTTASPSSWEAAALEDALSQEATLFRKFIWRYGSDIKRGRERFQFLSNLYVRSRNWEFREDDFECVLLDVAQTLPELDDGKLLKSDLIAGGRTAYSLLPQMDPLEPLRFLVYHPNVAGLSAPSSDALPAIRDLWPARSEEVLDLAEQAIKQKSDLRGYLLSELSEIAEPRWFLELTQRRPNVRSNIASANPKVLDSDSLLNVRQPELLNLLEFLPPDKKLANRIIRRLVRLEDENVALLMFERFPETVIGNVLRFVEKSVVKGTWSPPSVWLSTIAKSPAQFLKSGHIEKARSMKALLVFADTLDLRNNDILQFNPSPWAEAVRDADDDLEGNDRDRFFSFLLRLALAKPVSGCESFFECAFEPVHSALWASSLSYSDRSLFDNFLIDLGWWRNWDTCLRLRLSVVNSYVNAGLNRESFDRLAKDRQLAKTLVELAEETKKGRKFLKKPISA